MQDSKTLKADINGGPTEEAIEKVTAAMCDEIVDKMLTNLSPKQQNLCLGAIKDKLHKHYDHQVTKATQQATLAQLHYEEFKGHKY